MKKKRHKSEWFDDDSFWTNLYESLFPEQSFEAAEVMTERLVALTKPRGKQVLDLCCGPGRFAVPLAKLGYAVTGVDRTRYYLNKARARARSAKVRISLLCQDVREFSRPDAFDLAINMWSSFGYFADRNDDLRFLKSMHASLKPGGTVVIDNMGKELVSRGRFRPSVQDLPDGSTVIQRVRAVEDWSRVEQIWYVIRGDKAKRVAFRLNLYSAREMREAMEHAGFVEVQFFGNLKGDPYDGDARRQITVGRKR